MLEKYRYVRVEGIGNRPRVKHHRSAGRPRRARPVARRSIGILAWLAVVGLGEMRGEAARAFLEAAANDPNEKVREVADFFLVDWD
jgi:hypothetical protein